MRKAPSWNRLREIISYFVGVGGIFYEAVARHPPDYALIPVFVGMLGLPTLTRRDKRKPPRDEDSDDTSIGGGGGEYLG